MDINEQLVKKAQTQTATLRRVELFLTTLGKTGSITKAASRAGVRRTSIYRWRDQNPEFERQMDEAMEIFTDSIEESAVKRARDGVLEPVFHQGRECGRVRKYSDSLAQFILKGRRRAVYGDRTALTGEDGGAVVVRHEIPRPALPVSEQIEGQSE